MSGLTKIMMVAYKTLLVKMDLDCTTNQQAKLNYENLCDSSFAWACLHFVTIGICACFD